ncbi:MAG TPA: alpha/beta hydrolase [Candidatus Anoxymicrobiaceae bacterium]
MANTEKKRRASRRRTELLLAPVYVPAMLRVIDSLRTDQRLLDGEDLDLEHIKIESLDGTPLHMTACGQGENAVFFVHGWTCNESIFRFQQDHFRDRYRIYTLELRGHGKSGVPASLDYHPDRLAEDLKAAIDHVGPKEMVLSTPMTTLSLAAKACFDFHYDYFLPSVDVPVALLVGDRDKLTNRESNERTAGLLPDARLRVFEGAGHCAMLERREDFNAALESFLYDVFSS